MESDDAILALAVCACGHGIGRHDEDGCPGAQATFCVCTMTPSVALDAAIERIRLASISSCGIVGTPAARTLAAATTDRRSHGPLRTVEPATMITLLARRVIRPQ